MDQLDPFAGAPAPVVHVSSRFDSAALCGVAASRLDYPVECVSEFAQIYGAPSCGACVDVVIRTRQAQANVHVCRWCLRSTQAFVGPFIHSDRQLWFYTLDRCYGCIAREHGYLTVPDLGFRDHELAPFRLQLIEAAA